MTALPTRGLPWVDECSRLTNTAIYVQTPLCRANHTWHFSDGTSIPPLLSGGVLVSVNGRSLPLPAPNLQPPGSPACHTPSPASESSASRLSVGTLPSPLLSPSVAHLPAATTACSRPICWPAANMMCPCKKSSGFIISVLKILHD